MYQAAAAPRKIQQKKLKLMNDSCCVGFFITCILYEGLLHNNATKTEDLSIGHLFLSIEGRTALCRCPHLCVDNVLKYDYDDDGV